MEDDAAQAIGGPGVSVPAGRDRAGAAVTALFREHQLELVRLALVMTGDVAAAADAVQDAFERLYRRWTGLRNVGQPARLRAVRGAQPLPPGAPPRGCRP